MSAQRGYLFQKAAFGRRIVLLSSGKTDLEVARNEGKRIEKKQHEATEAGRRTS